MAHPISGNRIPGHRDILNKRLPIRLIAHEKLRHYFAYGTRLAWALNPIERNALVYRSPEADRLLRVTDALDGEDVLPGFRLPLAEVFAELSFD